MKLKITSFLLSLSLFCVTGNCVAQETDEAAMMQAWQNFMTPGEMHKMMATWEGTWDAEVSSWMDPAAPPTKSKAVNVVSPVFNGLYHTTHLKGDIMGMAFEGHGTMGYDNGKKIFVSTWIDNLGSGIIYMTGNWDEKTKTLHLKGTQTDPMTGKDAMIREEMKIVDKDTQVMTMYGQGMDGKETKFMEATYKRKK